MAQSSSNQLYLAVLPQISLSAASLGRTEQVLTLLPDRNLATEFFPDQVDAYVDVFERSQGSLTGGHVREYLCDREETEDGRRVVAKVTNVSSDSETPASRAFTPPGIVDVDAVIKLNDMYARNLEQVAAINARSIEQFDGILKPNTDRIARLVKDTHIRRLVYPGTVASVLEIIHLV